MDHVACIILLSQCSQGTLSFYTSSIEAWKGMVHMIVGLVGAKLLQNNTAPQPLTLQKPERTVFCPRIPRTASDLLILTALLIFLGFLGTSCLIRLYGNDHFRSLDL